MAKQDARQRALRKGIESLRTEGLPVDEPTAEAIGSFTSFFGKGMELDLAVVFLLGRIVKPAALAALKALEPRAMDREVKREVRRSLFKLAQKGLAPAGEKPGGSKDEKPLFGLGPALEGYLSSVDGAGNRLVWVARPQIGSGLQMIQGIVSDRLGLIQVGGSVLKRKELRRMMAEIKERHGVAMIPVPWEFADWVLYQGHEKAKAAGRTGLEHFQQIRTHMSLPKPGPRPHPIYDHINASDVRVGAWREDSKKLLDEPEFRLWVLDVDWIAPYAERVEEAQGSRLVLNPLQKEERLGRLVHHVAQDLFVGDVGELIAVRMEDMALYLCLTGRREKAETSLAVALAIKERDLGGLGIPFLYGLIQRSLAVLKAQKQAKEKEETEGSSLIIKP